MNSSLKTRALNIFIKHLSNRSKGINSVNKISIMRFNLNNQSLLYNESQDNDFFFVDNNANLSYKIKKLNY